MVVTVGASWSSIADRGGPLPASRDSGPLAAWLRAEAARPARTYLRSGEYGSWRLFRRTCWAAPHPVLPISLYFVEVWVSGGYAC